MTRFVSCKGIPSATSSATPKNLSIHWRMSVDKMCYGLTRFGRQKAPVNRKYGHDTQGVTGSSPVRPTNFSRKRFGSEREYLPSSLIYEQLSEHFEVGVRIGSPTPTI